MNQIFPVPGPSQDAFNALSDQIAQSETLQSIGLQINTTNVDSNNLFIRKLNHTYGVVTVNGYVTLKNAPTGSMEIGTIEQGARPINPVRCLCGIAYHAYDAPENIGYVTVGSSGTISVTAPSSNNKKTVYFSFSYHAQG